MFYSAIAEIDKVRKVDTLPNQDDPSRWLVVPVIYQKVSLYFALLNADTGPFGRIISALTSSAVYHVELRLGDDAPSYITTAAEQRLGLPYDFETILVKAVNEDSTYHTPGKEFCSGFAYEVLKQVLPGLAPYPTPGKLLSQATGMLGLPIPKLAAPQVQLAQSDIDWLDDLPTEKLATGIKQETLAALGVPA